MNVKTENLSGQPQEGNTAKNAARYWLATPLLAFPTIVLLEASVLFWSGARLDAVVAPLAGLALALLLVLLRPSHIPSWKAVLLTTIAPIALLAMGYGTSLLIDFTGDGQQYHQPGIMLLAMGWNPFATLHVHQWNPVAANEITTTLFIDHYAKGPWVVSAALYSTLGNFEATKLFTPAFMVAAGVVVHDFLARATGLSLHKRLLLSAIAAANPIALTQIGSFYVDGQHASLLTVLVFSLLSYDRFRDRLSLTLISLTVVLLINLKFTGLVYAGVLALAFWIYALRSTPFKPGHTMIVVGAFLVGTLLVGYQPYVTNTMEHGNPFYPAIGSPAGGNIERHQAPPEFLSQDRFSKLALSMTARSDDGYGMPSPKPPFAISKQEIYAFFGPGARYAGLGPLFGGAVVLGALGCLIAGWRAGGKHLAPTAAIVVLVTLSAVPNPEMWLARLTPQWWLIAVATLIPLFAINDKWIRIFSWGTAVALALNIALVSSATMYASVNHTANFKRMVNSFRDALPGHEAIWLFPEDFAFVYRRRLQEMGLRYRENATITCADWIEIGYPRVKPARVCRAP